MSSTRGFHFSTRTLLNSHNSTFNSKPLVKSFFDTETATWTYVVYAENHENRQCAVIDSVLNYDMCAGRTTTESADKVLDFLREKELTLQWILETHIHADHVTASAYLKQRIGGTTGISKHIINVLKTWVPVFQIEDDTPIDGSQFDKIFEDNEEFSVGPFSARIIHTPGHTPADTTYIIGDAVFVGDAMFLPDVGTGRCDFPSGDSKQSYASCRKLLELPEDYRMFVGHDYPPNNQRGPQCMTTIGEQRKANIRVKDGITENDYATKRDKDDRTRPVPKLLFPSVQANLRAGTFGKAVNGTQYVKIPVNKI